VLIGEDETTTVVPDHVGKLQIIIRKVTEDLSDEDEDSESEDSSDGTSEDSDESDLDESATSESDGDDSGDDTYNPSSNRRRDVKARTAVKYSSGKVDTHNIFTDWCEKKPRHTHTSEHVVSLLLL
jgi:hypothetical protein